MTEEHFFKLMGRQFVLIAGLFALGLATPFARRFYPGAPPWRRRLAAPVIFAGLAAACFVGVGLWALNGVTLLGLAQLLKRRVRSA